MFKKKTIIPNCIFTLTIILSESHFTARDIQRTRPEKPNVYAADCDDW